MTNVLFIMADQLSPKYLGAYGSTAGLTPNLDRLAREGTVFDSAYCNSPICVPARAAIATGRYPHQTRHWDNATPYNGQTPSWGHVAEQVGVHVTTIGKLHYKDNADVGFPDQKLAIGTDSAPDYFSLLRRNIQPRPELSKMIRGAGAGNSSYCAFDQAVAAEASSWLRKAKVKGSPWALFVSLVSPHHPLIAPQEYFDSVDPDAVELPVNWQGDQHHPVLDILRGYYGYDEAFTEDQVRNAKRTYLALTRFLDDRVGEILDTVRELVLEEDTLILFTADHGDNVGDHGFWWKNNMYEGSVGVPMIAAGHNVQRGKRVSTPVSHVDIFPTMAEVFGADQQSFAHLPGTSLLDIMAAPADKNRLIFSEYHAAGSATGMFMAKRGRYKYVEYAGEYESQLFDLETDAQERRDLIHDPSFAALAAEMRLELRVVCDPETVNAQAFSDQAAIIAGAGGEEAIRRRGFVTHMPVPEGILGKFDDGSASAGKIIDPATA